MWKKLNKKLCLQKSLNVKTKTKHKSYCNQSLRE